MPKNVCVGRRPQQEKVDKMHSPFFVDSLKLSLSVIITPRRVGSGGVIMTLSDSRQSGSIRCIYSSFLFNNCAFCHFNTVTTRIR